MIVHWILVWTGGANGNSPQYLELSGFIPDLAFLGVIAGWWHKHCCQEANCRRLGHHITLEDNGHQYRRCRTHHNVRHTQEGTP